MTISFVYYDFEWNNNNFILLGGYLIGMIFNFFKKDVNIKTVEEKENKLKGIDQSIEFKDGKYIYINNKFAVTLNKKTILEVTKSDKYTAIFLASSRFKSIITMPIYVPNNLFGSEELYNQFMNTIG